MKLLRVGPRGSERPAFLDGSGRLLDLSRVVDDITGATLAPTELARIRAAVECGELPAVDPSLRIGAPLARPGKIVCIGLNYRDHAAETGAKLPTSRSSS